MLCNKRNIFLLDFSRPAFLLSVSVFPARVSVCECNVMSSTKNRIVQLIRYGKNVVDVPFVSKPYSHVNKLRWNKESDAAKVDNVVSQLKVMEYGLKVDRRELVNCLYVQEHRKYERLGYNLVQCHLNFHGIGRDKKKLLVEFLDGKKMGGLTNLKVSMSLVPLRVRRVYDVRTFYKIVGSLCVQNDCGSVGNLIRSELLPVMYKYSK